MYLFDEGDMMKRANRFYPIFNIEIAPKVGIYNS